MLFVRNALGYEDTRIVAPFDTFVYLRFWVDTDTQKMWEWAAVFC